MNEWGKVMFSMVQGVLSVANEEEEEAAGIIGFQKKLP